jgi:23S rRNA (pseudouridine1915-N3)-methyltransferase
VRITLVAVGRLKERFWKEACEEYRTRLRPYATVDVVEVPDRDPSRGGEERAKAEEAADIRRALGSDTHVFALAVEGREISSEQLAERLERLGIDGRSDVAFVVGGSCGLAADIEDAADERISLGRITLPHNLARVVLLEQLYRAFKIIRKEPYHK